MSMYAKVTMAFYDEVNEAIANKKIVGNKCREEQNFDVLGMVKRGGDPHLSSFYKYCLASLQCPVEKWISYHKDFLDPYKLIAFIASLYGIKNIRFE